MTTLAFPRHIAGQVLGAATLALSFVMPMASQAVAQTASEIDRLYDAMRMGELLDAMRDEGLAYGDRIATDMLGGIAPGWSEQVGLIYDRDLMESTVRETLAQRLDGQDLTPAITFFTSEPGASFIGYEIDARLALADPDIEAAAREAAALAMADDTPRIRAIADYIAINDIIEMNVISAMNGNFRFFTGLAEGGALGPEMTEDRILEDLWSQEAGIRTSTTEWAYSFLLLAYSPASDAELETYVTFSASDSGQQINAATFAAFGTMFGDMSQQLGLLTARHMVTQEL